MNKLFTILLVFISATSFCQIGGMSISATGSQPAPSAMLDVSSTNKGFLMPRITQGQRDSITNPDFGLLILNTTTNCINLWLGATWKQLCGDCDFGTPVPGNNGPICEGQTLNLTATTILGASYQWSGPNGFTSNQQNPSITNATAGASGSYSVQATLNGCTSQAQSTVATVNAIPQTPTAGNNGPVCAGQSINLSSTTIIGASYTWSGPNNFSDNSQNPVITNIQSNQAGNYSVVASVSGCNSAPGSTTIVVNTIPSTPGNISGPVNENGNTPGQVYTINSVSGATSYNWTVPAGASITSSSDTTITVTFGAVAAGTIAVSATNVCGTSSQSILNIIGTQTFNATSTGYTGSIQTFTAPITATYTIQALGAAGGSSAYGAGYGASMQGDFNLTQGQQLNILVGQMGASQVSYNTQGGGGGGGGTFVVLNGSVIIAAGGGGGGGDSYPGGPGLTTTTGGSSTGSNISTGGTTNGAGTAGGGNYSGGSGGGATCCDGGYSNQNGGLGGGGGAGFTGNGGQGQNGPTLAYSYLNGGNGGYQYNYYGSSSTSYGGYGGGGNGVTYQYQAGGGGGGGYTGGGGGSGYGVGGGGGGGGSYNSGANQVNQQGIETGNGQVIITF